MKRFSIHVDLTGKRCVVVGAGPVGERRVRTLLSHGAVIRLVAPSATPALQSLAIEGVVTWMKSLYHERHLEDAFLVVAATDLPEINDTVMRDAAKKNILASRSDKARNRVNKSSSGATPPEQGNFIVPASVQRGDLLISVSTSGESPTLSSVVKDMLESQYGPEWEIWTALFGRIRKQLKTKYITEDERKNTVLKILADPDIKDMILEGNVDEAEARALACL